MRREEDELLGQTRQLLFAVSESSAMRSGNPEVSKKSLKEVFASSSYYSNLGLVDTNGEVLASALRVEDSDKLMAVALVRRVRGSHAFAIGDHVTNSSNRVPTVSLGCPVLDGAGQVLAVVVAWIELDWFAGADSGLAAEVPEAASWTLIDGAQKKVVRYPRSVSGGSPYSPDASALKPVLTQSSGVVEAPDARGVLSFYAFEALNSRLVAGRAMAVLGIPKRILFAEADQSLARNLFRIAIAASLAFVLGWASSSFLVLRPVKALVRASARLATGDLSTRTGLRHGKDELGQLTRTFDQMAQALEQRERERQLAEESLQVRDDMIRELPLLPAAVCVCDRSGAVELYNRTAVELWGWEPPEGEGFRRFCGSYRMFRPDGTPLPHSESLTAEVLRTGTALRNRELIIERPDGTRVSVLANVVPLRDAEGTMIGAVNCLQDITERKQAEEKLQQSNATLQHLSRRLVESQETERRHIARELHDEVGQTLTVAEMNLQALIRSSKKPPASA
ncbi:MAG: HAMP domain-containing protein [Verrucomicrobia bacterium]|nr:HAMP domain-containing protein [Verrucomicrobiota bacterium]